MVNKCRGRIVFGERLISIVVEVEVLVGFGVRWFLGLFKGSLVVLFYY